MQKQAVKERTTTGRESSYNIDNTDTSESIKHTIKKVASARSHIHTHVQYTHTHIYTHAADQLGALCRSTTTWLKTDDPGLAFNCSQILTAILAVKMIIRQAHFS